MYRVYEIFEVPPSGSPRSVATAYGLQFATSKLYEQAKHTHNECYAADLRTHQIVAHMNVPPTKLRAVKRVFQISYDEQSAIRRAELLNSYGYDAVSVISNEAAKFLLTGLLTGTERFDLFIIGHAAREETRREMAAWLKTKYPRVNVLALNPPNQQILSADFNAREDGPENWLPIVRHQLAKPR
jgi:hypothetical protein